MRAGLRNNEFCLRGLIWTPRSITLPRSRCACGVKSQNTCLSLLLRELLLRNSSNNASSLAINPSLTFFCYNFGALDSGIVRLKTGLDRASTVGKLGYWIDQSSVRDQEAAKSAWRYAFHFSRSAHNYSSTHVCKQNQNYSTRAHRGQEY